MCILTLLPKGTTAFVFLLGLLVQCNSLDLNSNDIPQIMEALQNTSQRITSLESSLTNISVGFLHDCRTILAARKEKRSLLLMHFKRNFDRKLYEIQATVLAKVGALESLVNNAKDELHEYKKTEGTTTGKSDIQLSVGECFMDEGNTIIMEYIPVVTLRKPDLALWKNTYASPRYIPHITAYISENAVDGNHRTSYFSDKVWNPWWLVDLGSQETISSIAILTRQDCCFSRFRDVEIRLGNELHLEGNFSSYQLIHYYKGPYNRGDGGLHCSLPNGVKGQFLSIQIINHREYLQLTSVYVFREHQFWHLHHF